MAKPSSPLSVSVSSIRARAESTCFLRPRPPLRQPACLPVCARSHALARTRTHALARPRAHANLARTRQPAVSDPDAGGKHQLGSEQRDLQPRGYPRHAAGGGEEPVQVGLVRHRPSVPQVRGVERPVEQSGRNLRLRHLGRAHQHVRGGKGRGGHLQPVLGQGEGRFDLVRQ